MKDLKDHNQYYLRYFLWNFITIFSLVIIGYTFAMNFLIFTLIFVAVAWYSHTKLHREMKLFYTVGGGIA